MSKGNPIDIYFDMKEGRIKLAQSKESETFEKSTGKSVKIFNYYVGFLRLIYMIHKNSHWKCKCASFYGNHLMFERLYKNASQRLDIAAEKLIGLHGNDALDTIEHCKIILENCERYSSDDHVANSLSVEEDFLKISKKFYDVCESDGCLTLGLDDMIMASANQAEEAIYLLKQASGS